MKGKLDAERLKELFLNHFEKIIFGVFVLFFLMMVLSAMQVEPYSKKPDQLSSSCNQAKAKLDSVQEVEPVTRNYDSLVIGIQEELPGTDYVTTASWNPILSKESQKRRAPKVMTVQNLQVKEWHGSVTKPQPAPDEMEAETPQFDDGLGRGRDSNTEGVRCCILVGELPLAEQQLEFQRKLGTSATALQTQQMMGGGMDATSDRRYAPVYYTYSVERAEVPADGDLEKIQKWEELRGPRSQNTLEIQRFNGERMMEGGGGGMDIPQEYAPPSLWKYYVAADARAKDKAAGEKGGKRAGNARKSRIPVGMDPNGVQSELVKISDSMMIPLPSAVQTTRQMDWNEYLPYSSVFEMDMMDGRRSRRKKAAAGDETAAGENEESEEDVDEESEEDDGYGTVEDPMMADNMQQREDVKVRLFRYVDYTVKPGKQYVYRVSLKVLNPNYQFEPAFRVENPEDRDEKYLASTWSNVTSPVTIPLDNHFYLPGFEKKYTTDTKEKKWDPYLRLIPIRFNMESGYEDFTNLREILPVKSATSSKKTRSKKKVEPLRLLPGQLLNLKVYEEEIWQLGNKEGMMGMNGMMGGMSEGRRLREEEEEARETTDFATGFVLLDVRGGDVLYEPLEERDTKGADQKILEYAGGIYTPAMVLLMGPKGELVIQSELEDVVDVYRGCGASKDPAMEDPGVSPEEPATSGRRSNRRGKNEEMAPPTESGGKGKYRRPGNRLQ